MKHSCIFSVTFSNFIVFTLILILIVHDVDISMGQSAPSQAPPRNQTTPPPPPTRTLRIAIPVTGFREFVSIDQDNITGEKDFNGFAVEVFKAVINTALSNPPSVNFVPFAKPDGTMNGTYDDMLRAISSQEYDGAVGDIGIRFYRTQWVDFTLPYSETGVSMLVPITPQPTKSTRITLRPLIKGLVSATLAFCFISALVFWFVEFKNDKFDQVSPQPFGANLQAQHANNDQKWRREMLRTLIHTRLVMVIWFLVLLFLTSCYTAGLLSLFTSQQQRVPIKNLNQLIRNRENVAYQSGSYVYNFLIQAGLSEKQLIAYASEKELLDMLSKGTAQGGVAAAVDETPFLKLFLVRHCNAYTLAPSVKFHAGGLGFAFQRESSLVHDISDGILKVIDSGQLASIQDRTIGDLETCPADLNVIGAAYNLLDFDTMWIMFAGALGITVLVIILYVVYFGTVCGIRRRSVAYPCYLLP